MDVLLEQIKLNFIELMKKTAIAVGLGVGLGIVMYIVFYIVMVIGVLIQTELKFWNIILLAFLLTLLQICWWVYKFILIKWYGKKKKPEETVADAESEKEKTVDAAESDEEKKKDK